MGHTEWGKCSWRAVRLGCSHEESRRHLGAVRAGLKSTTRANQVLPRELNRSSWKSDRPQTTAREVAGIFARERFASQNPPSEVARRTAGSRITPTIVVQCVVDRNRDEPSSARPHGPGYEPLRNPLPNLLVRPV